MWLLYQLVFGLGLVVCGPFLLLTRGAHYTATLGGRLGRSSGEPIRDALWIHAVSVGEVGVAATLLAEISDESPLVVTTVTPTGQERARSSLSSRATIAYLPFELGFAIQRFLRHFSPRALVLIEGEYWPLLMRYLQRRQVPIAVVNGRVSDRSFRRMKRIRPILGPLFRPVDRFGVQTEQDRRRLIALGAPAERVVTTGNLKFESAEPPLSEPLEALISKLAGTRPVLVAGSTMRGEEAIVLDAFRRSGGGESALLVVAPRHPERWDEAETLIREAGYSYDRRSRRQGAPGGERGESLDILLLDTLGELAGLYRHAQGAFIGGTLVPTGGHNPLEAARFGVPVAVGPSMENFRQIAEIFDVAEAWERARDAEELGQIWQSWWKNPGRAEQIGRRGAALIEENRGAVARTIELLRPILETNR